MKKLSLCLLTTLLLCNAPLFGMLLRKKEKRVSLCTRITAFAIMCMSVVTPLLNSSHDPIPLPQPTPEPQEAMNYKLVYWQSDPTKKMSLLVRGVPEHAAPHVIKLAQLVCPESPIRTDEELSGNWGFKIEDPHILKLRLQEVCGTQKPSYPWELNGACIRPRHDIKLMKKESRLKHAHAGL